MAGVNFVLLIQELQNEEERHEMRSKMRELRDSSDPLTLPENIFKGIFRLSRQTAHDFIEELAPHLRDAAREQISIPKKLKILMALNFFAQGSYQKSCGRDFQIPMCQSSVSNCIRQVIEEMNQHMACYIRFPLTPEDKAAEKARFMELNNAFPGIIGAIDCTHITIVSPPTEHPHAPAILFYNRKGRYSLNVQVVVNVNFKILAINARYPGSVHDSAIWATSAVQRHLIENYNNGDRSSWLLGDSGYPLQPWLMTPIRNPQNEHENAYNRAHKSIRNVVERFNGVFKAIFRDCSKDRVLHFDPVTAGKIINSCAILHNFRLQRGENIEEFVENICGDEQGNGGDADRDYHNYLHKGQRIRERIIRQYF